MLQNPDMFFLSLDPKYLFAKLFDIMFQQALIFMLIRLLLRRGLTLKSVSFLCAILFGFAHLYLLKRNGYVLGVYFVIFRPLPVDIPVADCEVEERHSVHLFSPLDVLYSHRDGVLALPIGLRAIA